MEQPHHETRNLGLLEIFSDEILLHIVSFLDGFSVAVLSNADLVYVCRTLSLFWQQVNYHMHNLCEDPEIWKRVCHNTFPLSRTDLLLTRGCSWKEAFVSRRTARCWLVTPAMSLSEVYRAIQPGAQDLIALQPGEHQDYSNTFHKRVEIIGDGPPGSVVWVLRDAGLSFTAKWARVVNVTIQCSLLSASKGCTELEQCDLTCRVIANDCLIMSGCRLNDVPGVGVEIADKGIATLHQNTLSQAARSGVLVHGKGSVLYENDISCCLENGIVVHRRLTYLIKNHVHDNHGWGVLLTRTCSSQPHFENNRIHSNVRGDLFSEEWTL